MGKPVQKPVRIYNLNIADMYVKSNMGVTLEKAIAIQKMIFEKCSTVVQKKGHDYNRKQQASGDTLFNMRISAFKGTVRSPQAGVLVRIDDKMMRLASLENPADDPANGDEKVLDTVCDTINYLTYFYMFYEEERNELIAMGRTINAEANEKIRKKAHKKALAAIAA